jgi:hypothetical protein
VLYLYVLQARFSSGLKPGLYYSLASYSYARPTTGSGSVRLGSYRHREIPLEFVLVSEPPSRLPELFPKKSRKRDEIRVPYGSRPLCSTVAPGSPNTTDYSTGMTGRALHYQNNEEPAVPWGWLRSAYIFCACSMQNAPVVPKCPRTTFAQNKKFYPQNVLVRLCEATFPCKNLVKKVGKRTFPRMRFRSLFFLRQVQFFEGGGDGHCFGGLIFLAMQGPPSHTGAVLRASQVSSQPKTKMPALGQKTRRWGPYRYRYTSVQGGYNTQCSIFSSRPFNPLVAITIPPLGKCRGFFPCPYVERRTHVLPAASVLRTVYWAHFALYATLP